MDDVFAVDALGPGGGGEFGAGETVADDGGLGVVGAPADDHAGGGGRLEVGAAGDRGGGVEAGEREGGEREGEAAEG